MKIYLLKWKMIWKFNIISLLFKIKINRMWVINYFKFEKLECFRVIGENKINAELSVENTIYIDIDEYLPDNRKRKKEE